MSHAGCNHQCKPLACHVSPYHCLTCLSNDLVWPETRHLLQRTSFNAIPMTTRHTPLVVTATNTNALNQTEQKLPEQVFQLSWCWRNGE
jgi:hypothetical protein